MNNGQLWQPRRAVLNHDWLRNRFILGIGRVARVIEGEVIDVTLDRRRTLALLDEWPERHAECMWLCDHVEQYMGPEDLFHRPPLSGLDPASSAWLRPLSVLLWKVRWRIDRRIACVRAYAAALDSSANGTRAALEALDSDALRRDGAVLTRVKQLRASALALSEALEHLPRGLAGW